MQVVSFSHVGMYLHFVCINTCMLCLHESHSNIGISLRWEIACLVNHNPYWHGNRQPYLKCGRPAEKYKTVLVVQKDVQSCLPIDAARSRIKCFTFTYRKCECTIGFLLRKYIRNYRRCDTSKHLLYGQSPLLHKYGRELKCSNTYGNSVTQPNIVTMLYILKYPKDVLTVQSLCCEFEP